MELYEHRIINGILKSLPSVSSPGKVQALLSCDIEIVADATRVQPNDLWPCIWALAAVLTRQFSGTVFVRCGLTAPWASPAALGTRVVFTEAPTSVALRIGVGICPRPGEQFVIWGDTRGARIAYQCLLSGEDTAHPISGFALAGYLGYAALASAVGMPPFRGDYLTHEIVLPFAYGQEFICPDSGLTFIGLGHLGQAYLALLYFLTGQSISQPRIVMIDKDIFEEANYSTQILLEEEGSWCGIEKAQFLAAKLSQLGWDAVGETTTVSWVWRRPHYHPPLAVLGLDSFDARRMAIEAGYEWVCEAGLGTSFLQPRVTWHSLPPERQRGAIFHGSTPAVHMSSDTDSNFVKQLRATPGQCGWVTYDSIQASAPSMGLIAAAYVWAEILQYLQGERTPIAGQACLWSPLLPFLRNPLSPTRPTT